VAGNPDTPVIASCAPEICRGFQTKVAEEDSSRLLPRGLVGYDPAVERARGRLTSNRLGLAIRVGHTHRHLSFTLFLLPILKPVRLHADVRVIYVSARTGRYWSAADLPALSSTRRRGENLDPPLCSGLNAHCSDETAVAVGGTYNLRARAA
jgi:hypothetical protein